MQTPNFFNRPASEEHPKVQSDSANSQSLSDGLQPPAGSDEYLVQLTQILQHASGSMVPCQTAPFSEENRPTQIPKLISLYTGALEFVQRRLETARNPSKSYPSSPSAPLEICDMLIHGLRRTVSSASEVNQDGTESAFSQRTEDAELFQSALLFNYRLMEKLQVSGGEQGAPVAKLRHGAEVGMVMAAAGLSRDAVIAGILHDTLEAAAPASPCYSLSKPRAELKANLSRTLARRFGANVEKLVSAATEPPRIPDSFDFIYRKSAIWQRLHHDERKSHFIGELAAVVCASKINTLAIGLEFLSRNQTTRGWSSGSTEENLFVCDALRKRFVEAKVPAPLLNRFDTVVGAWREFLQQSVSPDSTPVEIPEARDFDAEALLRAKQITIITGGQTGVDHAALDAALELGYPIKGFCPAGRSAEDGVIDERYPLQAAPSPDNAWRTIANAHNSDVTVILSRGTPVDGTPLTSFACEFFHRPYIELSLDAPVDRAAFISFINKHRAKSINIAGPRESLEPGNVYKPAFKILTQLLSPRP